MILLSDHRIRAVPVRESGEPLVRLPRRVSPTDALVRSGLAERLLAADAALPAGIHLRVAEGHRTLAVQRATIAAYGIGPDARAHRELLREVLQAEGLVNYPTEWWHWSYGDRYWAWVTGAAHATYGPINQAVAA
jgi:hypothetical protein